MQQAPDIDTVRREPKLAFSTRVRRSPFFEATRRWGCQAYTVYNRMYLPAWFESPAADFHRMADGVALWDVAAQRQVEITGPDAAAFVQYLTPRNLSTMRPGLCRYVLLTDAAGGIVNDPVLLSFADGRYWLSLADSDALLWAKGLAVHAGYDVELHEPDVSPLQLQGPRAEAVMLALIGDGLGDLRYFQFRELDIGGIPTVVSRTGWSVEGGFEIYLCDGSRGDELWERIMAAGQAHGIAPAAPSQISRIEGGMLSYGTDISLETTPFEAGLDRFVDLSMSAPFVGKAALSEIARRGVARRLVAMSFEGPPLPAFTGAHMALLQDGREVGHTTSAVHSPRLARNLALGYVTPDLARPDVVLEIRTDTGRHAARTAALPFVRTRRG